MSFSTSKRKRPGGRPPRGVAATLLFTLVSGLLAGCALLKPLPKRTTLEDRLAAIPVAGLPLARPVVIRWDAHQIPFIEAETDDDAAFALGLVHAHLRLGQMAVYRRIAQGRIAEMGGPLAADIDHGLRILDYGRAASASLASMSAEARRWLERFVAGINHYQAGLAQLPYEYEVLALDREPWTAEDVITFGRLAGTDVSWLVWFNLLKLRQRGDWPEIWARLVGDGQGQPPAALGSGAAPALATLLAGLGRSGSNSVAVAPARSRSGAALIASDPHVGINVPNAWLLVGLKSPSYHVVGLMIPGLPVFAIGRNPWIAWGGTNLRASASDMVDVSTLPAAAIRTRTEKIRVRWWRDRDITVRETPFGPILSDAPQLSDLGLPPTALHWTGHAASDEITAMLRVAGARSFEAFRDAFATFAVPGQNMLYADKDGNIGKLLAVRVPDRGGPPPDDIVLAPDEADATWSRLLSSLDLPYQFNPADGFLASANDRPTDSHAAVGYFFSPDDRVRRMAELMTANAAVGIGDLEALQRDVYLASSVALRDLLIDRMRELGITARASAAEAEVIARMAAWDGHYRADAAGPVAFELFRHAFTGALYENRFGETDWAAFANIGQIKTLMLDDISRTDSAILAPMLRGALAAAAAGIDAYPTWGDMHRLALRHPLQFLPVVGSRYRFVDVPIGGSTDTLMKTAHGLTDERHAASYGANARHISDLSDPDRNYFVLLGGQDGWLSSTTFLDQVPIWLDGDYVTMPLTPAAVERRFPHRMELRP